MQNIVPQKMPFVPIQISIHRDALVIKVQVVVMIVIHASDAKILMESENCQLANSLCYYPLAHHQKDISIPYRQNG